MALFDKKKEHTARSEDRKELEDVKKRLTKVEKRTSFLETQLKVIRRD